MSNNRFNTPFWQPFEASTGRVGAGWKLYFWQTGSTSTPLDTYSDADLTTPNPNPVVADGNGRFGDIFLQDGQYYVELTDENDVLIDDADPVGVSVASANVGLDSEVQTTTYGQTVFTLTTMTYTPGSQSLTFHYNGVKYIRGVDYQETSSTVITWINTSVTIAEGGTAEFSKNTSISSSAPLASNTSYTPAGTGAIATDVQSKLRQYAVTPQDFGAVVDGTTDDYTAFNNAMGLTQKTTLAIGTMVVGTKTTIAVQGKVLEGLGANFAYAQSIIQPTAALADYVIQSSLTSGAVTLSNFEIDGNGSTNALGGIYIKDDGSSLNFSNRIENVRVVDIATDDACAIKCEGWGSTLENLYIRQIVRGTGLKLGEGGVSGTTQFIQRAYIGECDACIDIRATTLGITALSPIMESSTVGWYQRSNKATMIEPYFENVNRVNNDGVNYSSLNITKVQDSAGSAVDYWIYLDGANAELNIFGGRLSSLNSVTNSKFLGVGSGSVCRLYGFYFPSELDERHIAEVGTGRIEIYAPKGLDIESVKDSVSLIEWGEDSDTYRIVNGACETHSASLITDLSRNRGDIHKYTTVDSTGVISSIVSYSASDVTTSTITTTNTDVDVASATNYRVGDYVALRRDDRSWFYTTIASIASNTLTLSDALDTDDATSGNTIKIWRWDNYESVTPEMSDVSISAAATVEILSQLPVYITTLKVVLVVAFQANNIAGIYRLFVANPNGAGIDYQVITDYEDGGFTSPSFSPAYTGGLVDIDMTNNDASPCTVSAKSIETISA